MKSFFVGISPNTSIDTEDIIGIFDMDTSTISVETRSFLRNAQGKEKLVSDVRDIPKSFVVTKEKVYLSQLSSLTLAGRASEEAF